jgi:hypothetical protein
MKMIIILFIITEKSFITLGIYESLILTRNFMKCLVQILSFWSVFNDNSKHNLCFSVLNYTAKRGLSIVNRLATFTRGGLFSVWITYVPISHIFSSVWFTAYYWNYFSCGIVFKLVRKTAKATISFVMSVCLSVYLSVRMALTWRMFMKFDIWGF